MIACPCALVISTPVTVVSALASAARRGILIKGGVYLEDARKLRDIALDKTGTITEGKPVLVDFVALHPSLDKADIALRAASLAARSDHPVSKAIAAGLKLEVSAATDFKALAGRGVQGLLDGRDHVLGNHRLIEERGQCSPSLEAHLKTHEDAGRTVTLLASADGVLGLFAVADTIKPSSRQALAELEDLGVIAGMLTGDNTATATTIAAAAGIAEAQGNLLPEDKLAAIQALQQRFGLVRQRDHVDGGVRRSGRNLAGGGERVALVAPVKCWPCLNPDDQCWPMRRLSVALLRVLHCGHECRLVF